MKTYNVEVVVKATVMVEVEAESPADAKYAVSNSLTLENCCSSIDICLGDLPELSDGEDRDGDVVDAEPWDGFDIVSVELA